MKSGLYLPLRGLDEKYPGGESLLDLAERSKKAITQLLLPHMQKVVKEGSTGIHVAVVSHGLCLGEMISELLKMSANQAVETKYNGLENTAWTRVVINIEVRVVERMVIRKLTLTGSTGKSANRRGSASTYGHASDRC
jgi:broad specificity phosphatase PhoE